MAEGLFAATEGVLAVAERIAAVGKLATARRRAVSRRLPAISKLEAVGSLTATFVDAEDAVTVARHCRFFGRNLKRK